MSKVKVKWAHQESTIKMCNNNEAYIDVYHPYEDEANNTTQIMDRIVKSKKEVGKIINKLIGNRGRFDKFSKNPKDDGQD